MTILIVGAHGQVGTELRLRAGAATSALARSELDITDATQVQDTLQRLRPQVLINAAAYTAVDQAEKTPDAAFAVNRDGARVLAQACAAHKIALLHLSTDYVFDGHKLGAYLESDAAAPAGVYAQSKWQGEQAIREHLPAHLILRVSWVFGAHGGNFVKTILRLARQRRELRVIADQHGGPTPAAAIAEALLILAGRISQGEMLPWGTYHFAGAPGTTWHGFASEIVKRAYALGMLPHRPEVQAIGTADYPLPSPRPANSLLDCRGAEQQLGLTRPDWRDGLDTVLKSLAMNPA